MSIRTDQGEGRGIPRLYGADLSKLVQTKSYSSQEENVCRLIVKLCQEAGFDEVYIDGLGSVIGRVGNGPKKLAFDAHNDTVEVGNLANWKFDPFSGEIKDGKVLGRGSSDQKGGAASMITAGRILKDLGYGRGVYTVYFTLPSWKRTATACAGSILIEEGRLQSPIWSSRQNRPAAGCIADIGDEWRSGSILRGIPAMVPLPNVG
jgi:hypothetical protein